MDDPDIGLCPWDQELIDAELQYAEEMEQPERDMTEAMAHELMEAQPGGNVIPIPEPPTIAVEDPPAALPVGGVVLSLSQEPSAASGACSDWLLASSIVLAVDEPMWVD